MERHRMLNDPKNTMFTDSRSVKSLMKGHPQEGEDHSWLMAQLLTRMACVWLGWANYNDLSRRLGIPPNGGEK